MSTYKSEFRISMRNGDKHVFKMNVPYNHDKHWYIMEFASACFDEIVGKYKMNHDKYLKFITLYLYDMPFGDLQIKERNDKEFLVRGCRFSSKKEAKEALDYYYSNVKIKYYFNGKKIKYENIVLDLRVDSIDFFSDSYSC